MSTARQLSAYLDQSPRYGMCDECDSVGQAWIVYGGPSGLDRMLLCERHARAELADELPAASKGVAR